MEHTNLSDREILLLLEQKVDGLGTKIDKFEDIADWATLSDEQQEALEILKATVHNWDKTEFEKIEDEMGFPEWIVGHAEDMINDALFEDMAIFAFGTFPDAVEAWEDYKKANTKRYV